MLFTTKTDNDLRIDINRTWWQVFIHWLADYKWVFIGCLWIVVIALGYIGFTDYFDKEAINNTKNRYWWDILYHTFQMFVLENPDTVGSSNWQLQLARFLAPVLTVSTSLVVIGVIFREQLQLFRLRFLKKHIVICGLGTKGLPLVEGFLKKGCRVVVIEKDGNNSSIPQCREKGGIVLIGNAADPYILRKTRLFRADYLIATCGEDGTNAEIAYQVHPLLRKRKGKALDCLIHIYDANFCKLLQGWEFGETDTKPLRLEYFNIFESGTKALLEQNAALINNISESEYAEPHVVVIGLGQMGSSLVVNLVRRWEGLPNRVGRKLCITVVDIEAIRKTVLLLSRYPELTKYSKLLPRQMDIQSAEFEEVDFLKPGKEWSQALAVFICTDDDVRSFSTALTLNQRSKDLAIPIIIRMVQESGLSSLLVGKDKKYRNIQAFSLVERTCKPELIFGCMYETLARVIHEVYLENERATGKTPAENPAMVSWEELTDDLKESNRAQAQHLRAKLRAIGYDLWPSSSWYPQPYKFSQQQLLAMAKLEHERFVKERINQGWRAGTPGQAKDLKRKINPTLVDWDKLPAEEQQKDIIFATNIPVVLARAGFEVYPL